MKSRFDDAFQQNTGVGSTQTYPQNTGVLTHLDCGITGFIELTNHFDSMKTRNGFNSFTPYFLFLI